MAIPNRAAPPPGWEVVRVGDVLTSQRHSVEPAPAQAYREIGIRSHGKGIFHKPAVTGEDLGDKRVFRVVPDCLVLNIVFAWEGAVAVTSANESGMIASHRFPMFAPARPDVVDVEFLRRYFLTKHGTKLLGDVSPGGAGRNRTLNQSSFASLTLPLPPLPEQKKIAAILSSVDETITKTEAVIAQLQIVKKAMMEQLLTKGMPGRHTRFKQTEIGEIPEEWTLRTVGELARLSGGHGFRPPDWRTQGMPIIRIQNLNGSDSFNYYDGEVDPAWLVEPGELLFAWAGSRGASFGPKIWSGPRGLLNQHIYRVTPGQEVTTEFLFLQLLCLTAEVEKKAHGFKDTLLHLQKHELTGFQVGLPTLDEQNEISRSLGSIQSRILNEERFLKSVLQARDALRSSLLSGEIRVAAGVA